MPENTFQNLRKPFSTKNVNWKVGMRSENGLKGQAVPHIDARAVQNRLDDVVGPSGWKNKFIEVFNGPTLFSVRCVLSLKIDGEWVDKEDAATLSEGFIDRNTATKGVYSDAMKRAAVQWGIGRYLYDYDCDYVDLDEHGRFCQVPKLPKELVPVEEHEEYFKESAVTEPIIQKEVVVSPEPAPVSAAVAAKQIVAVKANAQDPIAPETSVKAVTTVAPKESKVEEATGYPHDLPAGLTESEKTLIHTLLEKLKTNPPNIVRTYVEGPKGVQKLGELARSYIVKKANEKEKAAT